MDASTSTVHRSTSMTEESMLVEESQDFSSPWHFSDVVLVVEDTKFHVHKSTLSMWSPVFNTMFTCQFKESTAKEIPLPGKHADEVKDLLQVMYSSWSKPKITENNYQFLLQLADEYQMDRVKKLCSEFLVDEIEASNCLEYFQLAEKFGLDDVTQKCHQEVCHSSSEDLEDSEHFSGLEPELKVNICMKVIKKLERIVEEYEEICSPLVWKAYKKVYENFYRDISPVTFTEAARPISVGRNRNVTVSKEYKNTQQYDSIFDHLKVHKGLEKKFETALAEGKVNGGCSLNPKDYNTQHFKSSCKLCVKQVRAIPWNNSDSYSILKEPLNKLYDLMHTA